MLRFCLTAVRGVDCMSLLKYTAKLSAILMLIIIIKYYYQVKVDKAVNIYKGDKQRNLAQLKAIHL